MPPAALGWARLWERRELEFLFYYPNAGVGSVVFTVIGTFLHPYKPSKYPAEREETGHMCRGHHDTGAILAAAALPRQSASSDNESCPTNCSVRGCVVAGMGAYSGYIQEEMCILDSIRCHKYSIL